MISNCIITKLSFINFMDFELLIEFTMIENYLFMQN